MPVGRVRGRRIKPATVVDAPVSQIDLFATICDYLGAGRHDSDGASLRRYIEGQESTDEAYAVSEWNWRGPIQPNLMVRTKRWKYLRYPRQEPVFEQLFDMEADPDETRNLVGEETSQPVLLRLREELVHALLVRAECAELGTCTDSGVQPHDFHLSVDDSLVQLDEIRRHRSAR